MGEMKPTKVEWWPLPGPGEIVPDYPPQDITHCFSSVSLEELVSDEELVLAWNRLTPEEAADLARLEEETRAHNEEAIRSLRRDGVLDPERAERLLADYARPADREGP